MKGKLLQVGSEDMCAIDDYFVDRRDPEVLQFEGIGVLCRRCVAQVYQPIVDGEGRRLFAERKAFVRNVAGEGGRVHQMPVDWVELIKLRARDQIAARLEELRCEHNPTYVKKTLDMARHVLGRPLSSDRSW